jgi:hypothetical protein
MKMQELFEAKNNGTRDTMQLFSIKETHTGYWVTSAITTQLGDFSNSISIFIQEKNAIKAINEMNKSIERYATHDKGTDELVWECRINNAYETLLVKDISFEVVPLNVTASK